MAAATSFLTASAVREPSLTTPSAMRPPDRVPSSKKVKLSAAPPDVTPNACVGGDDDVEMGGVGAEARATQTDPQAAPVVEDAFLAAGAARDQPNLATIRQTISEQFDIEILLKHRELRLIEQEIAKTQTCIEQLRRCTLLPFPGAEASLSPQPNLIPGHYAPLSGLVDGPYTRHYRQWLLPDRRFDGSAADAAAYSTGMATAPAALPYGMHEQLLSLTGRPQRQSAVKVQARGTGEQVCVYRKRDGSVVKLVCGTCQRSNFNSAQGFINHCRIAHQTEYASHDAAAEACGQPIDPETTEAFISPPLRGTIDGPARNTRGGSQLLASQLSSTYYPTPQSSFTSSSVLPLPLPTLPPPPPSSSIPKHNRPVTAGKPARRPSGTGGRRSALAPKTKNKNGPASCSSSPAAVAHAAAAAADEKRDFATSHLEGLLKRKHLDAELNLQELVAATTEPRLDTNTFDLLSDSDSDDELAPPPLQHNHRQPHHTKRDLDGDTHMNYHHQYSSAAGGAGFSSDDEDDGGYRSDVDDDDELYSAPPVLHAGRLPPLGGLSVSADGGNLAALGANGSLEDLGADIGAFSPVSLRSPEREFVRQDSAGAGFLFPGQEPD